MAAAQIVPASPSQVQQLRAAAVAFSEYAGNVSTAVARRFAFWDSLTSTAARYAIDPAQVLGAELAQRNVAANQAAVQWARTVRALDVGAAQLAAWQVPSEGVQQLRLGVVKTGTLPTMMGVFPIVPVLVIAAGAVLSVGTWLLGDAWLTARQTEADALKLQTETQAKISAAVIQAGQQDPRAAAVLADALERANKSAQAPTTSIIDRLAGAVAGAVENVTHPAGIAGIGLLVLAYLFFQSRARGRR